MDKPSPGTGATDLLLLVLVIVASWILVLAMTVPVTNHAPTITLQAMLGWWTWAGAANIGPRRRLYFDAGNRINQVGPQELAPSLLTIDSSSYNLCYQLGVLAAGKASPKFTCGSQWHPFSWMQARLEAIVVHAKMKAGQVMQGFWYYGFLLVIHTASANKTDPSWSLMPCGLSPGNYGTHFWSRLDTDFIGPYGSQWNVKAALVTNWIFPRTNLANQSCCQCPFFTTLLLPVTTNVLLLASPFLAITTHGCCQICSWVLTIPTVGCYLC